MPHKLSCALFVLIGGLGTLMSVRMLFDPGSLLPMLDAMGGNSASLQSPAAAPTLELLGRWVATVLIGGNVFSVVVALTALRRKEQWAAWLMLYWPLMFASHFIMYAPGPMRIVQVVWLCLSVPAVVVLIARAHAHARARKRSASTATPTVALA